MERDIDKLRRWCIRRRLENWSVRDICAHARISRATFYFWWNKYQKGGFKYLEPQSRRPHTIHRKDLKTIRQAIALRKKYGWGPDKIAGYLKTKGMFISHNTVYRIICKKGLNNPLSYKRKTWGKKRFERNHSNSLWQADFKLTNDDRWMITYLDDHSRFVTGCKINLDATSKNAIRLLEKAIDRYGSPKQLLTDQGTQFVNQRGGITIFQQFCIDNGIKHIIASKRRPTTIGKVERFHRTYEGENHRFRFLGRFLRYYNYKRPNQAIGYLVPAQVYFRDMKNV